MGKESISLLIIDDVAAMRAQLKELAESLGFSRISVAGGSAEALQWMELQDYHAVICDWHMVGTSGIDFLRFVRAHPKHKNIAFLMLTAESTKECVIEAIKSGVDDYAIKPVNAPQLNTKLEAALRKRKVLT
jgi:two-component system chemotaxis response regulator CheY